MEVGACPWLSLVEAYLTVDTRRGSYFSTTHIALVNPSHFTHQQYTCMYTYTLVHVHVHAHTCVPCCVIPLSTCFHTQPDWQPLFVQLQELRINLKQQAASVLGIVSNAVMQGLIISILLLNMVGRFQPVDSYSLYICAIVIRVTELVMPLWFCCSLWNYKQ